MHLFGEPLELVILDVDGVILDFADGFERNFEAAMESCALSPHPFRSYLKEVRNGSPRAHARLRDGVRRFWPRLTKARKRKFKRRFREVERLNPYPPVHGSVQTIHWFRKEGIRVALCTTNEEEVLRHRMENARVDLSWFASIVDGGSKYQKPDPRALDPILDATGVPRKHAVYVGDWFPDLWAARGADVRFIAVLSGGIPKHAFLREGVPENHILDRLVRLPSLIDVASPRRITGVPR